MAQSCDSSVESQTFRENVFDMVRLNWLVVFVTCAFGHDNDSLSFADLSVLRKKDERKETERGIRYLLAESLRTCDPPRHQLLVASQE